MNSGKALRVFISYARRDGAQLARRLCDDLGKQGVDAWLDTRRLAGGATWTTEIEREIDNRSAMLALLTTGSYESEICRSEQLRALRKGKRVIPVLAQQDCDIPLHLEAKNYRNLSTAHAYATQFATLLTDLAGGKGGVSLKNAFRQTYVMAPPLPPNYVDRPEALAALRTRLITDGSTTSIAVTALRGMGGIGKTVLAQALCRDEVVQQAFPDGVLWVTAGREPTGDPSSRLRELRRALGDTFEANETDLECLNRYRTLLRDKAALVIVDDVWNVRDVQPFRADSPRSRILFTTRDASIAAGLGAEEHLTDLLTVEQSRHVFARWSGLDAGALPAEAAALIDECGRLPLALSMVGAMLRGKGRESWARALDLLRNADLAKIRAAFPDYPHHDLLRALQVSLDALDEQVRDRYLALAVCLEDMPVPPEIQQVLWNADAADAADTAEQLIGLSLAQRVGERSAMRLHDLQLDYVRAQHPDRELLRLVQGAMRLSAAAIERDPWQFTSQMLGRLLPHAERPGVRQFIDRIATTVHRTIGRPWLRPLRAALHPPGTALVRTLEGHSRSVTAVTLSPDGRRAVSASSDQTLKVWDLESGRVIHTLQGHTGVVTGVAVGPDARRAVSASDDRTLKVWDLESGRVVHTLAGDAGPVRGVAMTQDGRRVVSGFRDKVLEVWDLESGRLAHTLTGHTSPLRCVAVSSNGRLAVSGSLDRKVKVWDLESGRVVHTLEGHVPQRVAFTPNGRRVVSTDGSTLKVWDLASGSLVKTLNWKAGGGWSVAVSADGRWAVSASGDDTLDLWDLESDRLVQTLKGHAGEIEQIAVSPDGRRAVSGGGRALNAWNLESGRLMSGLEGHAAAVTGVAVTPDGRRAVSASHDGTLKVWDLESGGRVHAPAGHGDSVTVVAVTPDGRRAVSAAKDGTLKMWDLASGHVVRTLEGHARDRDPRITDVAVTPDGRGAVSASWDRTLKVWDLEGGTLVHTLEGHGGPVTGVSLTPDGRRAVSASWDKTLKMWDLESGRLVCTLEGHSGWVTGVLVTRDGRWAASVSQDHTVRIWDLESGDVVQTMRGKDGPDGLAVTPDGRRAVSHSSYRINVWDLESGGLVHTLTGSGPVAVTPDGQGVIAASWENAVNVWDLASGRLVHALKGHSATIAGVAVSRDGRRAVSASADTTLNVWDLETGAPIATFDCDAGAGCCAFAGADVIVAGDEWGQLHVLVLEMPD